VYTSDRARAVVQSTTVGALNLAYLFTQLGRELFFVGNQQLFKKKENLIILDRIKSSKIMNPITNIFFIALKLADGLFNHGFD
jgi:hypothetical protein